MMRDFDPERLERLDRKDVLDHLDQFVFAVQNGRNPAPEVLLFFANAFAEYAQAPLDELREPLASLDVILGVAAPRGGESAVARILRIERDRALFDLMGALIVCGAGVEDAAELALAVDLSLLGLAGTESVARDDPEERASRDQWQALLSRLKSADSLSRMYRRVPQDVRTAHWETEVNLRSYVRRCGGFDGFLRALPPLPVAPRFRTSERKQAHLNHRPSPP